MWEDGTLVEAEILLEVNSVRIEHGSRWSSGRRARSVWRGSGRRGLYFTTTVTSSIVERPPSCATPRST